ncbi:MAG: 2-amino-4-hydroxy-6-hydroxymethyldihydropteridine diphosphokinase [Thermoanaerobaculia bacterium]
MTETSTPTALALGANRGPCRETLRAAADILATVVDGMSLGGLYRSPPEAGGSQPDYWNSALIGLTRLGPEELLAFAKALERLAGRGPAPRNAPRPLDVDLLLWGREVRDEPALTLPHPRMAGRAFVLAPLADVAPQWRIPGLDRTVEELLRRADTTGLRRVSWNERG